MTKRLRADVVVVQQGLVDDIEEAKRTIMAGEVFTVKEQRILTAGQQLLPQEPLYIKSKRLKYVSRGGYKLEKGLESFSVTPKDKIALDIGSSTGGFTDAFLQYGAKKVYALDVGTNQLVWSLRSHPDVIVKEQTNFRYVTVNDFEQGLAEIASIDVSFISLKLILPTLAKVLKKGGDVIALIKPQFEAARSEVPSGGIITDPVIHKKVLKDIIAFAHTYFDVCHLTYSPIKGTAGNVEFLMHLLLPETNRKTIISENINVEAVLAEVDAWQSN